MDRQIKGYRDLSQDEINLMNEIKRHAEKTQELLNQVCDLRTRQKEKLDELFDHPVDGLDYRQIDESRRCLTLAKTNLQQGNMWFVRAVALPNSF